MAVAAYVSMLSFTRVLDNLHYRVPFHLPLLDITPVQTLQQKVQFLLEFVELHHFETETPQILDLWRDLSKLMFEAERMVDSHVVNLLYLRSQEQIVDVSDFCGDLERVISRLDIIKKNLLLLDIEEACKNLAIVPPAVSVTPPSDTLSGGKSVVVGFDEHVLQIKDQLTRNTGHLQILSIVGMGGIGKTTLARCVFDDSYTVNYFDRRIWVTISQEFSVQQILLTLLGYGGASESSAAELGERLYKELFGRKYLIVMDDMWSTEAWDELRRYFPDNGNGSRILVTTRLSNVAACLSSLDQYPLSFLRYDSSWDLFCQVTFGQKGCPHAELEEIGRDIVGSCRGLPMEISVIGRLLANSAMTREYWEIVGKNVSSFGNVEDNEHCLKVLSLSYKSLPLHLKACFLYLRIFGEDEKIQELILFNGWIAEGFVKPTSDKTVEEISAQYVKDLINRSLLIQEEDEGKVIFGVHDLLRDLCIKESKKEGFIRSPKVIGAGSNQTGSCFLCGKSTWTAMIDFRDTIVRFPPSSQDDSLTGAVCHATCQKAYSHITELKVVKAFSFLSDYKKEEVTLEFPTEVRYLYLDNDYSDFVMYPTIHLLWNLEVLNISLLDSSPTIPLPSEIWEMPNLRDVAIWPGAILAKPTAAQTEGNQFIILKNLWAISCLSNCEFSQEVVDRIPNLKYLNMGYEIDKYADGIMKQAHCSLCNIGQLQKLETLIVENALETFTFPDSLKVLILSECRMAWEDMSIIGALPVLRRLELRGGIEGSEWNPEEGEFVSLRSLLICDTSLKFWGAESIHFPVLKTLELWGLKSLEEFSTCIGDIPTLEFIELISCSESATKCAEQIREEQQELGNETLRVEAY